MEEVIRAVLTEIEAWGQEHDASEAERSRRMLNLEPDTAQLVSILVRSSRCTRLLEVGTSNGYSTIWLAWAARQMGGHVVSIERRDEKQKMAEQNLRRAGLQDQVTLHPGEARDVLAELHGPFDLVFLDADRPNYSEYLSLIMPRLTPRALLLADNVHSHPTEIADYLAAISKLSEFDHVVVGVGKGLSVAYRHG